MSDHIWIQENIAAYLSDGLEATERERLEAHIAECPSCAVALNAARHVDSALTALFVPARPSAVLEDRVIQMLRMQSPDEWRMPIAGWLAIWAAALLLVGVTGVVANRITVRGGLVIPGASSNISAEVTTTDLDLSQKEVAQLALESREKTMKQLDALGKMKSSFMAEFNLGAYPQYPQGYGAGKSSPTVLDQTASLKSAMELMPTNPMAPSDAEESKGKRPLYTPPLGKGPPPQPKMDRFGQKLTYFNPAEAFHAQLPEAAKPRGEVSANKSETKSEKPPPKLRIENETESETKQPEKKPQPQPGARKIIIRTGEIEYEIASFDAAVATITRLVKDIKGGFVATVNSDKLANGKVRGSVSVRVPPEHLDQLMLDLRTNLGKNGELKNQRLHSNDITKQYTDLQSRLKAARAMEERLLQIIKTGKGEIKDLLAVEKELGEWRTRIEEFEGSLRYYANQVALSTLTITLYEREISAPFGVVEREQVQMGVEVDDVDAALRSALKAVREAKGRITRSELKQPSQGQFSARLDFEVAPDAAGPLRDRLKQLGSVARLDISRLEETQGGAGKPSDGKVIRKDTRFQVSLYNLTNVAPSEVVSVNLACVDVAAAFKTLLAKVEKTAERITASSLNSGRVDQTNGVLQFEVKTTLADAVLEDVKNAGEVMRLQAAPNSAAKPAEATRKKRGFLVHLLALESATARESIETQLACADVAASYRAVRAAVVKAKGHIRNAQLNEQDRRNITATLDFEIDRTQQEAIRDALLKNGGEYTRKTTRAVAESDNVVDSKVRIQVTFLNQANIPPRETYVYGVEVADVDRTAAALSALVGERDGRTIEANVSRERSGRVTGKLIFDVPMAKVREVIDYLQSSGHVRVQQSAKHPEAPDSAMAMARLDVTLSNVELLVPNDDGFWPKIRQGLSFSVKALSWSLSVVIVGICFLLPWALVIWAIYRLTIRRFRAG